MEVVQTINAMQAYARALQQRGTQVAFVPTMGGLHEGHCSLIHLAKENADHVIASVFVNPTQFGPGEDLERYPRNLERDCELCGEAGADAVFAPSVADMYADGHTVYVVEETVGNILEGAFRPGHFRGVLTVVAKLFLAVQPQVAVFGRKDAQQLWLIQKMVRDLNFPIQIVAGPTVREADGLALSSRNAYLSSEHRRQATCLYRALQRAEDLFVAGERTAAILRTAMQELVSEEPDADMDYIEIVDMDRFSPIATIKDAALAVMAVRVGDTRLIDNWELSTGANKT